MAELRVGGLALVHGLKNNSDKNGKSVVLTRLITDEPDEYSTLWWEVEGDSGLFAPKNLLPISGGDFQHQDERKRELTHG